MVVVREVKEGEEIPEHHVRFKEFFDIMLREMDDNLGEKGNSWILEDQIPREGQSKDIGMNLHLAIELKKTFRKFDSMFEREYLPALANFCAMLYIRTSDGDK